MDWGSIIENVLRGLIGENLIYFGLAAMGLNIHFGYTGLLNFGQAVFMAAGAYGLAIAVASLGWSFWIGLPLGLIVCPLILAALMGIPTLRLRADYLAIVTIAVAEMFRIIFRSPTPRIKKYTNASDGLNGWIALALAVLIVWLLIRSPWGRVLKAIREDEDAARSLGKNAYWYKMQALALGGILGAAGGMLRAIGTGSAQPQNFITDVTFFAWVALILGGAGKVFGPVVGAALLYGVLNFTDSFLREAVQNDKIPESIMTGTQVGQVRFMLIGLGLVLLAAFRPQGIFGSKEEMALDDR
jgi:branched-chain amino acid transport system permease protein